MWQIFQNEPVLHCHQTGSGKQPSMRQIFQNDPVLHWHQNYDIAGVGLRFAGKVAGLWVQDQKRETAQMVARLQEQNLCLGTIRDLP